MKFYNFGMLCEVNERSHRETNGLALEEDLWQNYNTQLGSFLNPAHNSSKGLENAERFPYFKVKIVPLYCSLFFFSLSVSKLPFGGIFLPTYFFLSFFFEATPVE